MEELKVTYIGGPTVIIEIGGLRLMTDPTLDPAGSFIRLNEKMVETKTAGPAFPDPGRIDAVLLSHEQHFDNLDQSGRKFLSKAGVTITTAASAEKLGGNATGLHPWEQHRLNGPGGEQVVITATPARHGPAGVEKITGEVTGFIVFVTGKEPFEIYLTGDTTFYAGIAEVARKSRPDYVFIFAGAARPRGPFNVTMSTNDAIDTANEFKQSILIPLHSEGWSHYSEHNGDLEEAFRILGVREQLLILEPGVTTTLPVRSQLVQG